MSITAFRKLVQSSKATVLIAVIAMLAVMVYLRLLEADQLLEAVKVLVPAWLLAHAGEQGARAIANGKTPASSPPPPSPPAAEELEEEDPGDDGRPEDEKPGS